MSDSRSKIEALLPDIGMVNPLCLYRMIETWSDFVYLQVAWLEGKLMHTPDYFGSCLMEDCEIMKQELIAINKLGAVTTDSQPGTCTDDNYQRAYIEFYVPLSYAEPLVDCVKDRSDVYILAINFNHETNHDEVYFDNVPDEYETVDEDGSPLKFYNETYGKNHPPESGRGTNLYKFKWDILPYLYKDFPRLNKLMRDSASIEMVASEYCKGPITQILYQCLKKFAVPLI